MRIISQLLLTFLLNACWQVPLIAAFAALGSWLLGHSTARYRHLVWVAALFLGLLLPAFVASRIVTEGVANLASPTATTVEPTRFARDEATAPTAIATQAALSAGSNAVELNTRLALGLLSFYLMFLGFRGYRLVRAWKTTRAIRSSAHAIDADEFLSVIIDRCQKAIANRRNGSVGVRVLCSSSVPVPVTIGFLKPVIVLPEHLLREGNVELLTSAIGHEFIHVARRDYLLNLVYELIFLPLSFHPAAAILRRRIQQTRELCCDEVVAEKVLDREVYARSLVKLAGSTPPLRRLSINTTVGIADADILEVRIMSLLKPKLLVRRKGVLLAVSLLLALPTIAAASFGLRFNLKPQTELGTLQEPTKRDEKERRGRANYRVWPEYPEDARAAKIEGTVELSAMVEPDGSVQDVQVTRSVYPSIDQSAVAAVQKWRYEPYLKDGQPVSRRISVEVVFNLRDWEKQQEKQRMETQERSGKEIGWAVTEKGGKGEYLTSLKVEGDKGQMVVEAFVPTKERMGRELEEREIMAARQAELAKAARITMDQAIQIARGQNPGTVLECNLVGEHWEAPGRLAKDSQVLYHVVILSGNESKTTHVMVNALDGRIVTVNDRGRERNE